MTYITKSVDVDVEIELDDVLDFIQTATTSEKKKVREALKVAPKEPEAPFFVPVPMRGYAGQLIALGQLEELLAQMGPEEAVARLKS